MNSNKYHSLLVCCCYCLSFFLNWIYFKCGQHMALNGMHFKKNVLVLFGIFDWCLCCVRSHFLMHRPLYVSNLLIIRWFLLYLYEMNSLLGNGKQQSVILWRISTAFTGYEMLNKQIYGYLASKSCCSIRRNT